MRIFSKLSFDSKNYYDDEYKEIITDLVNSEVVRSMKSFIQHNDISCFLHSLNVSYNSFRICKLLKLNYESAARGALLHDLFLYDWHTTKLDNGMHGFTHPYTALQNAKKYFTLNHIEEDIIEKHMWPLTVKFPKYKESYIVSFVDKYCALLETIKFTNNEKLCRIEEFLDFTEG